MSANNLVFKELLSRGYSIDTGIKTWDLADSKLWYSTPKQAQMFLELEKDENYKRSVVDKEMSLIEECFPSIAENMPFSSCNLVDLGCGNGKKAIFFAERLSRRMPVRYCPVDISGHMVRKAAKALRDLAICPVCESEKNVFDFENFDAAADHFRSSGFRNHFLMLLGNTFGNFENSVLHAIKKGMGPEDVLLIGNSLLSGKSEEEMTKPYKEKPNDDFLIKVVEQAGLKKGDVEHGVRFRNGRVEMFYRVKRNKKINKVGREISFSKGDIILVGISYRHGRDAFRDRIRESFPKFELFTDKKETYALALCQKKDRSAPAIVFGNNKSSRLDKVINVKL